MQLAGDAPRSWPGGSSGEVYAQQTMHFAVWPIAEALARSTTGRKPAVGMVPRRLHAADWSALRWGRQSEI
jgi:hypothetical protein